MKLIVGANRLGVGTDEVCPSRRVREPAGLRQIVGEQRHCNTDEDGVLNASNRRISKDPVCLNLAPVQSCRIRDLAMH